MVYNMGSAILRAIGDSKRPLYFLCVSSVINIVLDLLFVIQFNMGVAGVAWATLIAQFASAILVIYVLARSKEDYRLILKDIKIHKTILKKMITIGFPQDYNKQSLPFQTSLSILISISLVQRRWLDIVHISKLIPL